MGTIWWAFYKLLGQLKDYFQKTNYPSHLVFYHFPDQFLKSHMPLDENVFKGEFIVQQGDFIPVATDKSGLTFVQSEKSRFYQIKLDQIFRDSFLSDSYMFNEVLLLESMETNGIKVHFNVHMSLQDHNVTASDVKKILKDQIELKDPEGSSYLAEIEIDPNSLVVLERTQSLPPPGFRDSSATIPFNYNTKDDSFSHTTGKCMPFDVPFCKELPYNFTIYPNGFGHRNVEEALEVVSSLK